MIALALALCFVGALATSLVATWFVLTMDEVDLLDTPVDGLSPEELQRLLDEPAAPPGT